MNRVQDLATVSITDVDVYLELVLGTLDVEEQYLTGDRETWLFIQVTADVRKRAGILCDQVLPG